MNAILGWIVDRLKQLPGFAYVLIAVTLVYGRLRGEEAELLAWQSAALALAAWLLYRLSARLDGLYDWVYRPRKRPKHAWGAKELFRAREQAATSLFQPIDPRVESYRTAVKLGYVAKKKKQRKTQPPNLYKRSSDVLKRTSAWEEEVAPWNELSKAARTIFVLSALLLASYLVPPHWLDVQGTVSGLFAPGLTLPFLILIMAASGILYWHARLRHHLRLYELVSRRVIHHRLDNGEVALIPFDVLLRPSARRIPNGDGKRRG